MSETDAPLPVETPPEIEAPSAEKAPGGTSSRPWLGLLPIIGAMSLLFIAVVVMIVLGVRALLTDRGEESMPLEITRLTPTPFASPIAANSCQAAINSGDIQISVALPSTLEISDQSFPVAASAPGTTWASAAPSANTPVWICGTVVNYEIVLESNAENEQLLTDLRVGDEIRLTFASGTTRIFRFVERREATADTVVSQQYRPGLRLYLESSADTWVIATADYASEITPTPAPPGSLTGLNQPVALGNITITALNGRTMMNVSGISPNAMYYIVDYTIENSGSVAIDTGTLTMQLVDILGNRYPLSTQASSAGGEYLTGEIAPGAQVQASAGYLVPVTMPGPEVIWHVELAAGEEAQFSISYQAQPIDSGGDGAEETPTAEALQVDVDITDAFLDDDVLIIVGEIVNN